MNCRKIHHGAGADAEHLQSWRYLLFCSAAKAAVHSRCARISVQSEHDEEVLLGVKGKSRVKLTEGFTVRSQSFHTHPYGCLMS